MANNNQKAFQNSARVLDQMKYEIAQEMGIQVGADTPSRLNGAVGGAMTARLVAFAEQALSQR